MSGEQQIDYEKFDTSLREYLDGKGYHVDVPVGSSARKTFTYQCTHDSVPYWIKIGVAEGDEKKRILELENEVCALEHLWKHFPEGETDSFAFPPGAEELFEGNVGGNQIYGYARIIVDGSVLGGDLRAGRKSFLDWVDVYCAMVKTFDTLPDLRLPRTREKKKEKFEKKIVETAKEWQQRLDKLQVDELSGTAEKVVQNTEKYCSAHQIVCGSVHGDLVPDHIVSLNGSESGKPTVVSFSRMSQWYPRYWDVAMVYSWVRVVLGDKVSAKLFWEKFTRNGVDKPEVDYLKMAADVVLLGTVATYLDPAGEGGKLKIGPDAFFAE